jgi:aspartyl-tRNA(Asn)/glutamyl-tRNA(Gln) amidotransferase subunit A
LGEGLSQEVRTVFEQKVEELKSKGINIKEVSIPTTEYGLAVYYILVPSEISSNRARYDGVRFGPKVSNNYEENLIKGRSEFLEDEVKRRIMIGTYSLSSGYSDQFYKKASKVRTKLKHEFENAFKVFNIHFFSGLKIVFDIKSSAMFF